MTLAGLVAIKAYSDHDAHDYKINTEEHAAAIAYFDENRDALPITAMALVTPNDDPELCDADHLATNGWKPLNLGKWSGNE